PPADDLLRSVGCARSGRAEQDRPLHRRLGDGLGPAADDPLPGPAVPFGLFCSRRHSAAAAAPGQHHRDLLGTPAERARQRRRGVLVRGISGICAALPLALLVAACGGGGDDDSTQTTSATPAAQPLEDLVLLSGNIPRVRPADFRRPTAEYRRYVLGELGA